jgi:hypothetical protein
MGLLIELVRYEPVFARPDESSEEAIRRLRPFLILLLDGTVDEATSDVFHARLKGTPLVLFATPATENAVRTIAHARSLPWFTLPVSREVLGRVILDAVAGAATRSGRDRRQPTAHHAADGSLIFHDRNGSEWRVYDRRGGDRRATSAGHAMGYRTFVNRAGEEWWYELPLEEVVEYSPAVLERQLSAAVKRTDRFDQPAQPPIPPVTT